MINHIDETLIILYVENQDRSTEFYQNIFRQEPNLRVPGMTEFKISGSCRLGLMPNKGIVKILEDKMPHPDLGKGIPRCELYLRVKDVQTEYQNAFDNGAILISVVADRDWGEKVCYFSDPDGHIIAFAEKIT